MLWRRRILADELRVQGIWESCRGEQTSKDKWQFSLDKLNHGSSHPVQRQEASPLLADARRRRKRCPVREMDFGGVPRQAEIEVATSPTEDCCKRHEKISTTDDVDWIVRDDGAAGGRTSPGSGACTSANTNAPTHTGACAFATNAHTDFSAEHGECGR